MAYQNFIPTVWSEAINRELERKLVFAEDCNRQYEGEVKKMGDTVRILGVGKPSITTTVDKEIVLKDPENVEDTSVTMAIRHISYFNFKVDDIDRRQAVGGVMDAYTSESAQGVANEMDKHIGSMALDKLAKLHAASAVAVTKSNILGEVDRALELLYQNDVNADEDIVMGVPPFFYITMRQAYTDLDTNNSAMLKNGLVGKYGHVRVKMSNNCAVTSNGEYRIMVRTKRAVAFANPMTHVEAYRPEKSFSDAVKGFSLYEAKIVRPKELVVLNVKRSA
ncbi:hypothetical protein H6B33_12195 [Gemmiger formicilis]|uniref:hypothetical protein n=1 Tax=Gemmiger formicilis TaxID=745368 RepID=UPI00195D014F|nr:hypothetical protein [Gemmiger formicilis]MBM6916155.1 hypothetical protein [Gemmiger formicilis]